MTTQEKLIKGKLNLLELGAYLGNVSEACRTLGYSRDTFYRLKKQYEENGLDGLKEISRRKPNLRNRVPEEIEQAVVDLALDYPAFGQVRAAAKLLEIKGVRLSPAGIRGIWARHELETKKKRLKRLEEKFAAEGCVLTESQIQALEAAQQVGALLDNRSEAFPFQLFRGFAFFSSGASRKVRAVKRLDSIHSLASQQVHHRLAAHEDRRQYPDLFDRPGDVVLAIDHKKAAGHRPQIGHRARDQETHVIAILSQQCGELPQVVTLAGARLDRRAGRLAWTPISISSRSASRDR